VEYSLSSVEGGAYGEMYAQEDSHWWFRGRRHLIWALLRHCDLPDRPRILDAGCGTGRNLVEFGSLGPATGIDLSRDAVAYCKLRGLGNVSTGTLDALPFGSAEFDLLFACDVLEHVHDDLRALTELNRVADRCAHLVITVPAYQWMWTEHDVQLHHMRRYTLPTLRSRARAAGWEVVHGTYFNTILLPPAAFARVLSKKWSRRGRTDLDRTPAPVNGILALPLRFEAAAVARGARLPAGVSVGLLCKKTAPV
jgi:SAM-dependent methyltransferase